MDRKLIKEKSKKMLNKNYGGCLIASLIASLLGGGSGGSVSLPNLSSGDIDPSDSFVESDVSIEEFSSFSDYENRFKEFLGSEEVADFITTTLIPIIFITIGIALFASIIGFIIHIFLGYQVRVGSCRFFLKNRKNQPVQASEIFQSYKDKTYLNVAKVAALKNIFISLWSLLFVIPGIIKSYEYAAVDYILAVNPTMNYKRAMELSKEIMKGHKFEYFVFNLSFIGWRFLSALTLGILEIAYVGPYYRIAEAEFFAEARNNAIARGAISYSDVPDYEEYIPQVSEYQQVNSYENINYQQPIQNPILPNYPIQTTNGSYDADTFSPDINS